MISVSSHIRKIETYKFKELRKVKLSKDPFLDMSIRYLNTMIIESKIDIKLMSPVKGMLEETC